MELSGLNIFKQLPGGKKTEKANCKECGFPTCMAFALKLAQKKTSIEKCPHCEPEFKSVLQNMLKKQQNEVTFGGQAKTTIGGETVLFRHEKTFVNKMPIAVAVNTNENDYETAIKEVSSYSIERVGEVFKVESIFLKGDKNLFEAAKFADGLGFSIIAETNNIELAEKLKEFNPILKLGEAKKGFEASNLVISAKELEELSEKSADALKNGFKNIVLELEDAGTDIKKTIENLTFIRRLQMLEKYEPFAYPVLIRLKNEGDIFKTTAKSALLTSRYANILVLEEFNKALLTSIYTLRQNLYADPQKPLQVESKVYEINEPDENAFVLVTTNFALSYFAVSNELDSIGKGAYLIVTPTEGMSVLTAWSAEKLTSNLIAKEINASGIYGKVKRKEVIIPGVLSHLKEELEEVLPDWEIVVGPVEAYMLPEFLKRKVKP